MRRPLLSVIILTQDEEANLPVALSSLRGLNAEIFVVDSGSTDRTLAIARAAGCRVVEHPWQNYATQMNWALAQPPITTSWVMRLDADERLTPELAQELAERLPALPDDVSGLLIKRRVYFWGRWIRHGGYYPTWLLRVWRTGRARCEQRWMDEHMVVEDSRTLRLGHDIIDENRKGLTFWTDKHNRYADREVQACWRSGIGPERPSSSLTNPPAAAGSRSASTPEPRASGARSDTGSIATSCASASWTAGPGWSSTSSRGSGTASWSTPSSSSCSTRNRTRSRREPRPMSAG